MRFAGQHQLNRALRISQNAKQAVRIVQQQIGTLVSSEAPRKAQGERVRFEEARRKIYVLLRGAMACNLACQPRAQILNHRFPGLLAHTPEVALRHFPQSFFECREIATPAILAAGRRP